MRGNNLARDEYSVDDDDDVRKMLKYLLVDRWRPLLCRQWSMVLMLIVVEAVGLQLFSAKHTFDNVSHLHHRRPRHLRRHHY